MHYPDAVVIFADTSLFAFEHNGSLSFTTHTESLLLMAKVMMPIPNSNFRIYSSFGLAEVHRSDELRNRWAGAPAFGAGVNYNFTDRVMGEIGGIYSAGYGQSELDPVEDYIPFLYSVVFRLAYRFSVFN